MSGRATVMLGALFAIALAAFVLTGQRERRIERAAFEAKRLFQFQASDIRTLSIQQQGGEPVEAVRRDDGGWELAGAYQNIRAYGPLWDQLAEVLTVARNERPIPDAESAGLASFELDAPRLTVVVGTRQGVAHQLDFGGLDPTQRHRYLRMGDEGVFLSSAELFSILNRSLLELRDRRVFSNLSEGLTKIEYERYPVESEPGEALDEDIQKRMTAIRETYAKDASGAWRLVSPVEAVARQDRLQALERVLPALGGRAYVDDPEDLADYGLKTPFARVTVHGADGSAETLYLGAVDTGSGQEGEAGLFTRRENGRAVIVVDARLFTLLPGEPEAFREKRLFTREAAHLKTLRYQDRSRQVALENGENGWSLVEPPGETDQVQASMYIAQLKRIEGRSFPEGDTSGVFGAPRIALEFTYDDGSPPSRIEVGGTVPGTEPIQFYARQDFGGVTTISFVDFQTLQATPFDFMVKSLLDFDPHSIDRVDLTVDGSRYVFERPDNRWVVSIPEGHRLEASSDVTTLLATLASANATGIADPPPASEVRGLDEPVMSITLRQPDAAELGPLRVGSLKADESRERFASVGDRDVVYFVDQSLVDAARACVGAVRPGN